MGQIVLAAKVTHVPSLLLSEREGALKGRRKLPIASLKEIGKRAHERGADTFLIFDTHWLSNFGFHINANERHTGNYTSHEAPHMIQDLAYDYPGNPALADLIVEEAAGQGLDVLAHRVRSLALEYGSIVPMRYMNVDSGLKVLPVASPLFASVEENRKFGEACRRAILRSDSNVAVLASGSLSHKVISNRDVGEGQWDIVSSEFNRQMDLRVLELWRDAALPGICRLITGIRHQMQRRSLDGRHRDAVRPARLGKLRRDRRAALRLLSRPAVPAR